MANENRRNNLGNTLVRPAVTNRGIAARLAAARDCPSAPSWKYSMPAASRATTPAVPAQPRSPKVTWPHGNPPGNRRSSDRTRHGSYGWHKSGSRFSDRCNWISVVWIVSLWNGQVEWSVATTIYSSSSSPSLSEDSEEASTPNICLFSVFRNNIYTDKFSHISTMLRDLSHFPSSSFTQSSILTYLFTHNQLGISILQRARRPNRWGWWQFRIICIMEVYWSSCAFHKYLWNVWNTMKMCDIDLFIIISLNVPNECNYSINNNQFTCAIKIIF